MSLLETPRFPAPWLPWLLCLATAAGAESDRLRFRHLTVEDGLANSWVRAILKDSRGFVWFGTDGGLTRYDGAGMTTYRAQPGVAGRLPSPKIVSLSEDRRKRLWIGLGSGAIAQYDSEQDRFREVAFTDGPAPATAEANEVFEDTAGRIWVATTAGLYRLDPAGTRLTHYWTPAPDDTGFQAHSVWDVAEDAEHRIWLATEDGLYQLDPATGTASRPGDTAAGALATHIRVLYTGEPGALWCLQYATGALIQVDLRTFRVQRYAREGPGPRAFAGERARRLSGDGRGHLYVGTEDAGLSIFDLATRQFTHYAPDLDDPASLSSHSIWALHHDDQDILWVGTFDSGVSIATPFGQRFGLVRALPGRLSNSHVTSVIEDRRGALWIATDGGGVNRLERATGRFTHYRHDPADPNSLLSDAVLALLEDGAGRIWIGTWAGGLQALDPRTGRFTTFLHGPDEPASLAGRSVRTLAHDGHGRILVGVWDKSVQVLDPRTGQFAPLSGLHPGAGGPHVYAIAADRAGNLWLGLDRAQYLDRQSGRVTTYELDSGAVYAVLVDSRNNVWFGTESGGLQCLEAGTRQIRRFTTADGLPSDNVVTVLEDEAGHLWLGTTRGLVQFEGAVHRPAHPRFRTFDARDGLQGDEFRQGAALRSRSGELFFGGQQGLSFFQPRRVSLNPHPPDVILTAVRVFDKVVLGPLGNGPAADPRELVLSAEDAMVTFEFAALDFVAPRKNTYSYRLEGFDDEWSPPTTERRATYTNLPPGTYRFRVRAANNDGVWNEEGASLAVRRTPRFHETPWFTAGLLLGLASAAGGWHRVRVRRHLRAERELNARFEEARAKLKTLTGLLPVCAWCRRVRDDGGYWSQIDIYLREHSEAAVAESRCPDCAEREGAVP